MDDRDAQLAKLIREQDLDRRGQLDRLDRRGRGVLEADLERPLDRHPGRSDNDYFRLIGSDTLNWSALEHAAAGLGAPRHLESVRLSPATCPVCEDRPLAGPDLCLACNRSGRDGLPAWPGLSRDLLPEPPRYHPGKLRGGHG